MSCTFPATMLARRGRKPPAASIASASSVIFFRIVMLGIDERRRRVPLRTVSHAEGFCCRLESESSRLSLFSILDRLSSSVVAGRVPASKPSRSTEWPRLSVSSAVDSVFAAESAWGPSFDLTGVPTDVLSARSNVFGEGGNASSPPATLYRLIMVEGIWHVRARRRYQSAGVMVALQWQAERTSEGVITAGGVGSGGSFCAGAVVSSSGGVQRAGINVTEA